MMGLFWTLLWIATKWGSTVLLHHHFYDFSSSWRRPSWNKWRMITWMLVPLRMWQRTFSNRRLRYCVAASLDATAFQVIDQNRGFSGICHWQCLVYLDERWGPFHVHSSVCPVIWHLAYFLYTRLTHRGLTLLAEQRPGTVNSLQYSLTLKYHTRPSVCLSVCPSFRLSVTPFSPCSHHRIIMKFSGVITMVKSDVHAKGHD